MLSGLSWLYGKIIDIRNSLFDQGKLRSTGLSVPVFSVGNITVGGTGKTPLVAFIAEYLNKQGHSVCVISRGYKRRNENLRVLVSNKSEILADVEEAGDEPSELARQLLGIACVVADSDRVNAAKWAINELGVSAIVLDDAFQHRKIKRDLDIVVVDATRPFGNSKTLPSGILREPLQNLARAEVIVITRWDQLTNSTDLENQIAKYAPGVPIFRSGSEQQSFALLSDSRQLASSNDLLSKPLLAFCGLGNPDNFYSDLTGNGFDIKATHDMPDHHVYQQSDIDQLEQKAKTLGVHGFITTAKDAVKLERLKFDSPCIVSRIRLAFKNEKSFVEKLDKALSEFTRPNP